MNWQMTLAEWMESVACAEAFDLGRLAAWMNNDPEDETRA